MSVLNMQKHEQPVTNVEIWQVKEDLPDRHNIIFCNSKLFEKLGVEIKNALYNKVWDQPVDHIEPEEIYYAFNMERPMGFSGHSLSVSDVIVYKNGEDVVKSLFCDSFGFTEVPNFFPETHVELQATRIQERMSAIYDSLYKNCDDIHLVSGSFKTFSEAVDVGDEILRDPEFKPIIKAIVGQRGDVISSDRETAALAVAFDLEGLRVTIDPELALKKDIVNELLTTLEKSKEYVSNEAKHLLDNGLSSRTKEGRIHKRNNDYVEQLTYLVESTQDVFFRDDRRFTVYEWMKNQNANLVAYGGNPRASLDRVVTIDDVNNGYKLRDYDGMFGAVMNLYNTLEYKYTEEQRKQQPEQAQSRSRLRRENEMSISH